jgi:heterodisulfide reductase subunit B
MNYLFYPGCSMQSTAQPYLESLRAIEGKLAAKFTEIEDWNCCGATEYMASHRIPAYALVARNLALAESQANGTHTLLAACSACYLNLAKTDKYMRTDQELDQNVNEALSAGDLHYTAGAIQVRHLMDVLYNDIGVERIKELVERPLEGLRVAPYYGCMIVRPDPDQRWEQPEYPSALEEMISATGAEAVDFPLRSHCCSGHMPQISPQSAYGMIRRLVHGAVTSGADLMVTLCPMCQLNLDAYQYEMNRFFGTNYHMPIVYFTQLLGLAFGLEAEELGIGKEFVSAAPALARIGVLAEPEPDEPRKRAPKPEGLPMPKMPASIGGRR